MADDSRELGVEFGDLADDLETLSYPVSKADLVDELGEREVGLPDGSTTLGDALAPMGERTYHGSDEVRQAVLDAVGDEAVGREGYSDRGSAPDAGADDESL